MLKLDVALPLVAVIVAVPGAAAINVPASDTFATAALDVVHCRAGGMIAVPPAVFTLTLIECSSFGTRLVGTASKVIVAGTRSPSSVGDLVSPPHAGSAIM